MNDSVGAPAERTAHNEADPEFPQANAVAVQAIAGTLAPTLGPMPRDKLIVESMAVNQEAQQGNPPIDEYVVTSDGSTILQWLPLEHPVGPVVERMVGPERPGDTDIEGKDIPDGVSTSVVLAAALLDEAIDLIERGIHPQSVIQGYDVARQVVTEELVDVARPLEEFEETEAIKQAVAETAMTGNDVGGISGQLAQCAVEAATEVGFPTEKSLAVRQFRDGSINDSRLVRGSVLDRNSRASEQMPRRVEDADVLVLGGHDRGGLSAPELDADITADVDSPSDIEAFDDVFDEWRADICESILTADVDVVVTELGINQEFVSFLSDHDILGIRGVNRLDLSQVALATNARIVSDPRDIDADHLGNAGVVEEQIIDRRQGRRKRRRMTVFDDCEDPASVCAVLRGVDDQIGQQATTNFRKAAAAVATAAGPQGQVEGVVPGGGATELEIASAIREKATADGTRVSLAMEAFADAVDQIPYTLAANAGRDPIATLADLRVARDSDNDLGLVLPSGEITDVVASGVLDSAATRHNCYRTAVDVASLLLRVDDAVDAEVTESEPDPDDAIFEEPAEQQQAHLED